MHCRECFLFPDALWKQAVKESEYFISSSCLSSLCLDWSVFLYSYAFIYFSDFLSLAEC